MMLGGTVDMLFAVKQIVCLQDSFVPFSENTNVIINYLKENRSKSLFSFYSMLIEASQT